MGFPGKVIDALQGPAKGSERLFLPMLRLFSIFLQKIENNSFPLLLDPCSKSYVQIP